MIKKTRFFICLVTISFFDVMVAFNVRHCFCFWTVGLSGHCLIYARRKSMAKVLAGCPCWSRPFRSFWRQESLWSQLIKLSAFGGFGNVEVMGQTRVPYPPYVAGFPSKWIPRLISGGLLSHVASAKAGTATWAFYDGLWVPLLRDGQTASEVGRIEGFVQDGLGAFALGCCNSSAGFQT